MFRQILVSLVVLIVAAAGYVYFVPGSDAQLRNLGINIPFPTSYAATPATAPGGAAAAGAPAGAGQAAAGGRPGGGAGGPGGAGGFARQTPTVITTGVTTSTINDKLNAVGQGVASQSVSVTSQATGTLLKLAVKPGDQVKAGDTIATLDSDAEQIAYDKAKLAQSDASDALDRTQTLSKSNNATTVQLSTAQLALDNANLELRNAKLALDKRTIVTPISGRVGLFQVTAGNAVGTQTVVTTVDDTSSVLVNFWVPERYVPSIKNGMPVTVEPIALPDRTFKGTVTAVDSRIDPASRTLQVQASVPNPDGAVTAGTSFTVAMTFPGDTYPAVDPLAIQWAADGSYVWLLTPDSKVKKDKVQIVERNSDGVLVKGDLKTGQQVVTQGVLQLADNATVRQLNGAGNATGNGSGKPADGTAPANGQGTGSNAGQGGKPGAGGKPDANGKPAAAPAPSAT